MRLKSATSRKHHWQRLSLLLASAGLGLGLLDLARWFFFTQFDYPGLLTPETSMGLNTLLSLVLAGCCLLGLHRNWLTATRLGLLFMLAFTLLSLARFYWETSWEIGTWIFPAASPGWMSLMEAFDLSVFAIALLLLSIGWFQTGQLLAAFLFTLAYASFIGNLYNIGGIYSLENFSGISSHTALTLTLFSLSLLLSYPTKGWIKIASSQYSGGMLARFNFTYFLLVAPIFIGFYLYTLNEWHLTPGVGILSLFILTCVITLPVTFYFLRRLNSLDARLQKAHQELQMANTDLSDRNEELSEALADVKAGNRELAVMTKEVLLSSQALEVKNKELSRLNQSLDYIVQMASHDLKTPVFNLELLLKELKSALEPHIQPHEAELVIMVGNATASLKSTIEGLTQIIRSQQLIIGLQVAFSLTKLIQEIRKELEREIQHSNAQIQKNLQVDTVVFSRIHLRSVFLNLFTNALKYRAPDRPLLINITAQPVPGGIEIIFTDNGLGMSEYQVSNLFTIYRRFHAHVEGSGIGLYLVKQTVENNGGTIRAESNLDTGTRFIIFLPQHQ
ncbi:MAG: hypothetical protein JWQ14_320 [Adhaeribacter sp.]|nr:hypothetical protein [Adhaeribacter sp.]